MPQRSTSHFARRLRHGSQKEVEAAALVPRELIRTRILSADPQRVRAISVKSMPHQSDRFSKKMMERE